VSPGKYLSATYTATLVVHYLNHICKHATQATSTQRCAVQTEILLDGLSYICTAVCTGLQLPIKKGCNLQKNLTNQPKHRCSKVDICTCVVWGHHHFALETTSCHIKSFLLMKMTAPTGVSVVGDM